MWNKRNSSHGSCTKLCWKLWKYWPFFFFVGNLLVIIAFLTTPKLKTKTNYFIFSLAIADLLVGLFSVPLWIYVVLSLDFSSLLYQYYKLADTLSGSSSILHLTCVSVERCYAIVAPLKHRKIRKGESKDRQKNALILLPLQNHVLCFWTNRLREKQTKGLSQPLH